MLLDSTEWNYGDKKGVSKGGHNTRETIESGLLITGVEWKVRQFHLALFLIFHS